jgi:putative CocE/NonD family hydrolase
MDQRAKEDRPDILVYSTPPLERAIEVTGPVRATIWASSSAVDTDFTAMLVDVAPSGEAINLCDGILRARWRSSRAKPMLLAPGQAEKFEIDLVATSNLFKKGHRVRLEVASSNFPRFDRNLNTGKGPDSGEVVVATNTVFHDTQRASYVEMDVVPR